jgi:hypothetical protein
MESQHEQKEYATAKEVAPIFRTNVQQIYEWTRRGVFPAGCFIRVGRKLLYDEDALRAWAKNGGSTASGIESANA